MRISKAVLALVVLLVGGCALAPGSSHEAIGYYDFGPGAGQLPQCVANARLGNIDASSALQGTRMWYRHEGRPYSPMAYAISRWLAPPQDLLQRYLLPRFGGFSEAPTIDIEMTQLELRVGPEGDISRLATQSVVLLASHRQQAAGGVIRTRQFILEQQSEASPAGSAEAVRQALDNWWPGFCLWANQ